MTFTPRTSKRLGQTRGMQDARRYDADPEHFEPSDNPFGMDSESSLHEAWQEGYEDRFEGCKTKP